MTQTITERVKAAPSPSAAVFVLAESLEEIRQRMLAMEQASGWDEWSGEVPPLSATPEEIHGWAPEPWVEPAIKELEARLATETDELEVKALSAKLELLKDKLVPPPDMHDNKGDHSVETASPDGSVTIELPPATDEQRYARTAMLPRLGLTDEYGEEMGTKYAEAFVKGGPLLLYYADRDFVGRLPADIHQQFVNDVEAYSPQEAHEMARDLFRDPSPGELPTLSAA